MLCNLEHADGSFSLQGEMTIYAANELKTALLAVIPEGDGALRLDVSGVSEVDTTGLQLLLLARKICEARKVEFSLYRPSNALAEALALLHLGDTLPVIS